MFILQQISLQFVVYIDLIQLIHILYNFITFLFCKQNIRKDKQKYFQYKPIKISNRQSNNTHTSKIPHIKQPIVPHNQNPTIILNQYIINMLTKYLTVLVILVQSVHSISTPTTTISSHLYSTQKCDESQYTMYYLALTSVGSFCDQNKCDANRLKNRNINLLTIHGFWPSTQDRTFFSCMKQYQYDPFCYNNYKFNLSTFTAKEQQEMNRYWPKLTGRDTWSHEWSKHGSCYMHIMKHYFNSTKPNSQIVKDYFLGSVQKAKSLNISLPKGQYATKQRLSKVINLHPNYFQVICHDDNIVQQIKVCYDLSDVPRKQELVQCPVSKNRDICRFPIKVI